MEAKMALIEILRKYELVQTPDTEVRTSLFMLSLLFTIQHAH